MSVILPSGAFSLPDSGHPAPRFCATRPQARLPLTTAGKWAKIRANREKTLGLSQPIGILHVLFAASVLNAAADAQTGQAGQKDAGWTPQVPETETFHLVRFETTPEGAAVFLDGKLVCERTPCSRNVPGGPRKLTIRLERHGEHNQDVSFSKSGSFSVALEPRFGWISVAAEPGLDVSVDGVIRGKAPLRKIEAAEGRRSVSVTSPCHYIGTASVDVERGREHAVTIAAVPIEGALNVTASDEQGNAVDAEVLVDGRKVGTAPGVFKVSVCARELQLKYRGASVTREIKPVEKEVTRVHAVLPAAAPGAELLAAGVTHNCAVLAGGVVKCWGERYGPAADEAARLGPLSSIAAGWSFTCAALKSGGARCWGYNDSGQLGNGNKTNFGEPTPVKDLTSVVSISAGHKHACAVTAHGEVFCWGDNSAGQLAAAKDADVQICRLNSPCSQIPIQVGGLSAAAMVAAGGEHTCALLVDGTARCWGANSFGQLGDGSTARSPVPVRVKGLSSAVAITAGMYHSCAVISDGTVECWGLNDFSRLGVFHKETPGKKRPGRKQDAADLPKPEACKAKGMEYPCSTAPVRVPGLADARSVSAGVDHTCALLADGTARCWGKATDGRIGDGGAAVWSLPSAVKAGQFAAVSAGGVHTCALARDGSVMCWGKDDHGVLGNGKKNGPDACTVESDVERLTVTCAKTPVWVKGVGGR
jgi:alpha-tubulin suppressor-like RCC1 family protein